MTTESGSWFGIRPETLTLFWHLQSRHDQEVVKATAGNLFAGA